MLQYGKQYSMCTLSTVKNTGACGEAVPLCGPCMCWSHGPDLLDLVGSLEVGAVVGETVLHHHVVAGAPVFSVHNQGYKCNNNNNFDTITLYTQYYIF